MTGSNPSAGTKIMNMELINARFIAQLAHKDQVDKGGAPYIKHPEAVAAYVAPLGEKYQIVAWLHDTVEDTIVTIQAIRESFGDDIADAVLSVTRLEPKYAHRLGFPVAEKETYKDFVQRSKANVIGRQVKIADILHNMSEDRMSQLPESERGMVKRYRRALQEICTHTYPSGEIAWSEGTCDICKLRNSYVP